MKLKIFIVIFAVCGAACQQAGINSNANQPVATTNSNANSAANKHQGMDHGSMNHDSMNHDSMNHNSMNHADMKSAPNAANAEYDLQFLDTMIAHHEGAVQMALPVESRASRSELKTLAKNIVKSQTGEINQMREWRVKWFAAAPSAVNMDMAGMHDSMKDMDMGKLGAARGAQFDTMFVEQMIPHHEGAIVMSNEALQRTKRAEIKTLANEIIKAQQTEIKMMRQWLETWKQQ